MVISTQNIKDKAQLCETSPGRAARKLGQQNHKSESCWDIHLAALATKATCLHHYLKVCKILKAAPGRGSVFLQPSLL